MTTTTTTTTAALSNKEEPKNSSAALCIELFHHNNNISSFRPEYTHQCFDGEWIRGYLPFDWVQQQQQEATTTAPSSPHHSSYANHELATHELKIQIKLAPSCEECQVILLERTKRNNRRQGQRRRRNKENYRSNKKVKVMKGQTATKEDSDKDNYDSSCDISCCSSSDAEEEDDSEFKDSDDDEVKDNNEPMSGKTRQRRMSFDDIKQRLQRALPPIVSTDCSTTYLSKPIGTILETWTNHNNNKRTFTMTLANGAEAREYHSKVQNLALWFIETASPVDLISDEGGGYWKVLYVFEAIQPNHYALVGYMTLFHFYALFKKPNPGIVVRVCQALILPCYQRMGFGQKMLLKIHDASSAVMDATTVVELTVQDPAPSFTALRNRVDYELLKNQWCASHAVVPPTDTEVIQLAAKARIIPNQVYIAYELYRLHNLLLSEHNKNDEAAMKEYRLMVKKRLLKVHREELSACSTKESRQALLGSLFDEVLESYKRILKTV